MFTVSDVVSVVESDLISGALACPTCAGRLRPWGWARPRRFDVENTFRFVKNTLDWTTPALRTPEQADRWTWLVAAAYTQLRLARSLVDDLRLPLERRRKPGRLTPGSGRHKRTRLEQRTRYPAIKKAA